MHAEDAYLFRHALSRDAAYQMQVPSDRAKLHQLALSYIETAYGGRAPAPPSLDEADRTKMTSHATDSIALQLSWHAEFALASDDEDHSVQVAELHELRRLYLQRAAEYAERSYRIGEAISAWETLANLLEGIQRGEAFRKAGALAANSGDLSLSISLAEKSLQAHRAAGSQRFAGRAVGNLGILYMYTGRLKEAEEAYEQALKDHRATGDQKYEGMALTHLGVLYRQTGRVDLAESNYERAIAIQRKTGHRAAEGALLGNLASLYLESDRVEKAEQTYMLALPILRATGDKRGEGLHTGSLACVLQALGKWNEAEQTFEKALEIIRTVKDVPTLGVTLGNLATLYRDTDRLAEADNTFNEAIRIHREVGNNRFEGSHLCDYAIALVAGGSVERGEDAYIQGMELLIQLGDTVEATRQKRAMRKACAKAGIEPFALPDA
jgi:tetratricopeptide (TPR) repeat protein